METYALRVWLPDRPGALGAVASRIGAVRGDVVGIEILETGAGQAVDELVVHLPDATVVDLLVSEVRQVDGVLVEEVRHLGSEGHDPRQAALDALASAVTAPAREALLAVVCGPVARSVQASWVAVIDLDADVTVGASEGAPAQGWLAAFVHGARSATSLGAAEGGTDDVIWAPMADLGLALVAGRDRVAWRARERRQVEVLAEVIAARWSELS